MPNPLRPAHWPGFEIAASAEFLLIVEELVAVILNPDHLLGTARMTWVDQRYAHECGDEAQRDVLRIYLAPDAPADLCAQAIREMLANQTDTDRQAQAPTLQPMSTPDADWATQWKEFFQPIPVSEHLLVLPAWWDADQARRDFGMQDDAHIVRIDPGQAFGSGTHATTQLSLRLLERSVQPGHRILDFGAGSGILSFACRFWKASCLVGIEIDPESLDNFQRNAALNGCADAIDYRIGSSDQLHDDEVFDLVVCNALFHRVSPHFSKLLQHLQPTGLFVYSGFLLSQQEEVETYLRDFGLECVELDCLEEWGALIYRKPG